MKPEFTHASEAFKRLNPHLFGLDSGVRTAQPERLNAQALDGSRQGQQTGAAVVASRPHVTIIICRKRIIDDDNLAGGCKYLRDAIAASLRLDDSKIDWEYHQLKTDNVGTIVKIQLCQ